ncbi:MAG: DUF2207 domain-containing protein [Clostridia bacterium]|nr:DUF2207 domain-containing protein [Clostridia bacterium]MDD4387305.1 DUF2207 domain-containing protein [Clostridia bacterium]
MDNIRKICLMLIVSVLCFSTTLFAAEYKVIDYKIEANVKDNGDMDVVEYLKYSFDESANGVYRDILYKYTFSGQKNDMKATSFRYQANGIENINIYTSNTSFDDMVSADLQEEDMLSNGMDNVYSISDRLENGNRTKIKAYSPISSGEDKYVKYEYTIKDVIVDYNDYAEFYWNFVGADWECNIDNFAITVSFPVSNNIQAFGHTYANLDNFEILDNSINMKVSNISAGTAVDIRAVFPNKFMGNVNKKINENYDFNTLTNIENQMAIDREKYIQNYDLSNKIWIFYVLLNIIAIIFIISKIVKCRNKNIKTYKKVEHYTQLPDAFSLADYSCIKNKLYGYSDPNLVVATILDLSNRKYIKLESLKKAKIFKSTYEYYVSADNLKNMNELSNYEKELLNYIFNKKLDNNIDVTEFEGNRFELNERFKELGKDYKLGEKYRKSCADKTSINDKKMYNKVPNSLWKTFIYTILMLLIAAAINIFFISPVIDKITMIVIVIFIELFVFFILGTIILTAARSLKDEYVDEFNKLLGLQKYLTEYSLIKERYPIETVLWGKYLVFASLFGIADKVSKEFKEELLSQGYDENYIYTTYPMLHMAVYSHAFTASAASMSGSSSSGGYSGGGGGGGRRRWWRIILATKIKRKV